MNIRNLFLAIMLLAGAVAGTWRYVTASSAESMRSAAPAASAAGLHSSSSKVTLAPRWQPAGSHSTLAVRLQIAPGWHVNANPASLDYLVPTTLSVESNLRERLPSTAEYPAGEDSGIRLDNKAILVYDDGAIIRLHPASRSLHTFPRDAVINVLARVQACSDDGICLAPATVNAALSLQQQAMRETRHY